MESTEVRECLRADGFDNVDEVEISLQEYHEILGARRLCDDSERAFAFYKGITSLSDNARKIINIILNLPAEFEKRYLTGNRVLCKQALWDYLRDHGWKQRAVKNANKEIASFLKKFDGI